MLTKLIVWLHRRKQTRALNDLRAQNAILRFTVGELQKHREESELAHEETLDRINSTWKFGGLIFNVTKGRTNG